MAAGYAATQTREKLEIFESVNSINYHYMYKGGWNLKRKNIALIHSSHSYDKDTETVVRKHLTRQTLYLFVRQTYHAEYLQLSCSDNILLIQVLDYY